MSISVKRHEVWCTFRDMRLSKGSIIIIIIYILASHFYNGSTKYSQCLHKYEDRLKICKKAQIHIKM